MFLLPRYLPDMGAPGVSLLPSHHVSSQGRDSGLTLLRLVVSNAEIIKTQLFFTHSLVVDECIHAYSEHGIQ